ncbi:interleukin 17a/f2 [Cololabis saira]|uniref:interleukin 17a/f2 n=1 Tax=Cololabis saira TaxID=129043 RepID=UPI002AD2416D|nr:interleukin 17a/f2 [Cololabis saira]
MYYRDNRNLPIRCQSRSEGHKDSRNPAGLTEGPEPDPIDNMKLPGILLLCFSAVLDCSSSKEAAPDPGRPPVCGSTLTFSSGVRSWSEGNGNIHRTSLSPWSWRSTTVKTRIPSTLWEAECTSRACSSPDSGQTDVKNLNSVPIYQNILVLEKNGSRCYTALYRSVAVGCTCVWAEQN